MKKVLTGLQPTGVITLGNYIGAIKQMIKYQNEYESYLFIADMHAITINQDKNELRKNIKSLLALYLACGIDPNKNIIYIQSDNEYHTNLSWILECNTYFGELSRMTQFKDKSSKNENFSAGLFTYPVLMAADILLYDIDYVPVGLDQKQHVELARDIAIRFNKKYGDIFKVPEPLLTKEGTKIMDLVDPTKKMSKSSINQKGVIRLLDNIDDIKKKILSATTDSDNKIYYDMENKPGISNLLNIYSVIKEIPVKELENKFKDYNYKDFKEEVADAVADLISNIQEKYYRLINSDILNEILDKGMDITRKQAKIKYEKVKEVVGLGR
ncbi:MAG TPA: tryptophan--tRNA ligase [Bacilli bacterium]|nr:tryptophan--tRNA ligase [Bacilli bacterium]